MGAQPVNLSDQPFDLFDHTAFQQVVSLSAIPLVSLSMPAERKGRKTQQQPIRLKNLLRQAEEQLQSLGLAAIFPY